MNGLQSSCSAFLQCTTELQELQGSILLYRHVSVLCQYSFAQCVNRDCPPVLKKNVSWYLRYSLFFYQEPKGFFLHVTKERRLLFLLS